eukprot:1276901-Prymnesium_polylepis.2
MAAAAASRRSLHVRWTGHQNAFGWGHALPAAFLLHWLCVRAARRCAVELLDFRLDSMWGYANGEKWGVPPSAPGALPAELPRNATSAEHRIIQADANGAPWDVDGGLEALAEQLRAEPAPLVELRFRIRIPLGSEDWLSALPMLSAVGGIDRCFCRYVTRPRFLQELPRPIRPPSTACAQFCCARTPHTPATAAAAASRVCLLACVRTRVCQITCAHLSQTCPTILSAAAARTSACPRPHPRPAHAALRRGRRRCAAAVRASARTGTSCPTRPGSSRTCAAAGRV